MYFPSSAKKGREEAYVHLNERLPPSQEKGNIDRDSEMYSHDINSRKPAAEEISKSVRSDPLDSQADPLKAFSIDVVVSDRTKGVLDSQKTAPIPDSIGRLATPPDTVSVLYSGQKK